jgi:hypothetical protein
VTSRARMRMYTCVYVDWTALDLLGQDIQYFRYLLSTVVWLEPYVTTLLSTVSSTGAGDTVVLLREMIYFVWEVVMTHVRAGSLHKCRDV